MGKPAELPSRHDFGMAPNVRKTATAKFENDTQRRFFLLRRSHSEDVKDEHNTKCGILNVL